MKKLHIVVGVSIFFGLLTIAALLKSRTDGGAHLPGLTAQVGGTTCSTSILPANEKPSWMTSADFNRDGRTDLVVLDVSDMGAGGRHVSVYISNGNGTFQPKADYTPGGIYRGIAAGDFDQDGFPDIALSNNAIGGSLTILRNNGQGEFPAPFQRALLSSTMGSAGQIAVGDVNNDGDPDLLVESFSNGAQILYGSTGTSFTPGPQVGNRSGNQMNPTLVDVNNDGFLDAVTTPAGVGGSTMVVYMNDRTGRLSSGTPYSFPAENPYTQNLFSGDMNNDGFIDFLQATNSNRGIIHWKNNGNGTFTNVADFSTVGGQRDGAIADFNSDGKRDFFTGNYVRSFFVYPGNGNGTFGSPVAVPLPVVGRAVVAEDFDGNGFPDIAMALAENRNGILILLNDGSCLLAGSAGSSSSSSSSFSSSSSQSNMHVTLKSVTIEGGNVTVIYGKDFETCAHLHDPVTHENLHIHNYFCDKGTQVKVTQPNTEVRVTVGQSVILCHGNDSRICSAPVTVKVRNEGENCGTPSLQGGNNAPACTARGCYFDELAATQSKAVTCFKDPLPCIDELDKGNVSTVKGTSWGFQSNVLSGHARMAAYDY
ncbi:MAG: VCBS repeat-containing protein, partial [Candidatus Peregrinibacteria bacterium]